MAYGRRVRPSVDGLLLIFILASPVPAGYGASLNGLAASSVRQSRQRTDPSPDGPTDRKGRETHPSADGQPAGQALGVILGDASVRLNNQPVVAGMAVFEGDVIQTGRTSGAIVNFRSGASATLAEGGEVALEWENNPTSLNLRQGVLVVQEPSRPVSRQTRVHVLGASVMVQGEGEFPALCRIAALGRGGAVFNTRGHVEIHGAGAPFVLPSGKSARLQAGGLPARLGGPAQAGPQAAGQRAGSVSKAIPDETVQRANQPQTPLKIQDTVNWEDLVRTLKNGRVQIALVDGSTLNVGARSEFRVTKHDPATGQTTIEMTVGKLRADVVKITKPGGSFQVKTQTAVIGVVGTSFIVFATFNNTRVTCLDGLVSVSSLNPAIVGTATLHAGQLTNVPRGLPPSGAFTAPSGQVNSQISQTNVGGGAGAPGGAGLAGSTGNALNAGTAAAGATTVTTSGVTISAVDSASGALSTAANDLSQSSATSSSATSSANSATTSSTTTTTTITTITQTVLSPSAPCGCQ